MLSLLASDATGTDKQHCLIGETRVLRIIGSAIHSPGQLLVPLFSPNLIKETMSSIPTISVFGKRLNGGQ